MYCAPHTLLGVVPDTHGGSLGDGVVGALELLAEDFGVVIALDAHTDGRLVLLGKEGLSKDRGYHFVDLAGRRQQ